MRLLVVGAGATGGYFGGRLAQAGRDVTFLVRRGRATQLRERGLEIRSPYHGDAIVRLGVVTADELDAPFDAVLLSVKGFALQSAMDDFAPAIGPDTIILPVLNGMRHMDVLKDRFGAALIGGLCKCATTLDGDGRIVQLTPFQELVYGETDGRRTDRIAALDAFLADAGVGARLSSAITREMWEKWLLLASLGAVTCLMRGNIGQIEAAPGGREFILGVIDEVVSIISTAGVPPSGAAIDTARAQLTQAAAPTTSSMFRDLQAGLPVEADEIIGDLVRRGKDVGVAAPLLQAAYTNLKVYQASLVAGR